MRPDHPSSAVPASVGGLRAVIYARYSSDSQRDASIEDQFRVCSTRVEREGWTLIDTFADHATSGATMLRPRYQALLAALRAGRFDIVVAESLDRFSRDLEHTASFFTQAEFQNVRIHTLAEGDIPELHIGLKGVMGALYLKDLADKTRRGLEGRIRVGRCTGSAPYGYVVVRKLRDDGERDRGLRAIDPAAATLVHRIFTDYAAGMSPCKVAQALNAEGVPGPGGGIWYDTSIRGREKRRDGILRNALYVGRIVWRRRINLKDPTTGARLRRDAAPDTFVTAGAPDLRIIDDALWEQVQTRLQAEAAEVAPGAADGQRAFWDRRRPKHLLSGKVICGVCGRPFYPTGKDYLACHGARHGACSNRRTVRRTTLEAHVMEILGRQLMQPKLLTEFLDELNAEWKRLGAELRVQAGTKHRERLAIERKIANLVDVVSEGGASPAILAKLKDLEAILRDVGEPASPRPPASKPDGQDSNPAACYAARIAELAASLTQGGDPEAVEIARGLIDQVIIHPPSDGGPSGIEFIGNLIDLLKAAGLGEPAPRGVAMVTDPVLNLFASSVKEGPGAEPLAFQSYAATNLPLLHVQSAPAPKSTIRSLALLYDGRPARETRAFACHATACAARHATACLIPPSCFAFTRLRRTRTRGHFPHHLNVRSM